MPCRKSQTITINSKCLFWVLCGCCALSIACGCSEKNELATVHNDDYRVRLVFDHGNVTTREMLTVTYWSRPSVTGFGHTLFREFEIADSGMLVLTDDNIALGQIDIAEARASQWGDRRRIHYFVAALDCSPPSCSEDYQYGWEVGDTLSHGRQNGFDYSLTTILEKPDMYCLVVEQWKPYFREGRLYIIQSQDISVAECNDEGIAVRAEWTCDTKPSLIRFSVESFVVSVENAQ